MSENNIGAPKIQNNFGALLGCTFIFCSAYRFQLCDSKSCPSSSLYFLFCFGLLHFFIRFFSVQTKSLCKRKLSAFKTEGQLSQSR